MAASAVANSPIGVSLEGQSRCVQFQDKANVPSPWAARQMFTICRESNEENSPRALNTELARLEASSGLVNLTSEWPDTANDTHGIINDKCPTDQIKDANTDVDNEIRTYESDEDLILVTDKSTQTADLHILQQSPSVHQNSSSTLISRHQGPDNHTAPRSQSQLPQLSVNELISHDATDDPIEEQAAEAPTLKVEYVGQVWHAYINDFLLGCDHIDEAAIYDIATKKCIACSSDFTMKPKEFEHLDNALTCLKLAYRTGVDISGRHYKITLADGRRGLMAKSGDMGGCSACRTRTLIIIALHSRGSSSRICNEELMNLGDFFWAKGL